MEVCAIARHKSCKTTRQGFLLPTKGGQVYGKTQVLLMGHLVLLSFMLPLGVIKWELYDPPWADIGWFVWPAAVVQVGLLNFCKIDKINKKTAL